MVKEKAKAEPKKEALTAQELKLLVNIIAKATTTIGQANTFIVLANKCSRIAQALEKPKTK